MYTGSENRGRQNQEGVRSEPGLVAIRSRGPKCYWCHRRRTVSTMTLLKLQEKPLCVK